jgi:hypothetical protein
VHSALITQQLQNVTTVGLRSPAVGEVGFRKGHAGTISMSSPMGVAVRVSVEVLSMPLATVCTSLAAWHQASFACLEHHNSLRQCTTAAINLTCSHARLRSQGLMPAMCLL